MKITKILLFSLLMLSVLFADKPTLPDILNSNIKDDASIQTTFKRMGPTVQIGILLDTSNSMDGLIDQAKDQLWKIVNEVAKANKNNKDVKIEVGLFEYGKSSLPSYEGYLQMLIPLNNDLDEVSEALFALKTNGGEEYAGKVILESVNRFVWSSHKDDLKILIIAGNESFAQGDVPFVKAIEKAKKQKILVNTIFCGSNRKGINLKWKKGAELGGGKYFSINSDKKRVYIPSPYDDEIISLGKKLNHTYIKYGEREKREYKMSNIARQDSNSLSMSKESYVERNIVKSKKQYSSASSDMVDSYIKDEKSIEKIKKEYLPKELQEKSTTEIKSIIKNKSKERIALQDKIRNLEAKRGKFLAKKPAKASVDFGSVLIKSIRKQAESKGFLFKK
jgi:hypothetical protein